MQVKYKEDGLEAIVFTAQGDMRQALNNLQSTHNGFGEVNSENVFKVCDEPHPMLIKDMLKHCLESDIRKAYKVFCLKETENCGLLKDYKFVFLSFLSRFFCFVIFDIF